MSAHTQELRIAKDAQQRQPGTDHQHSNAENDHPRREEDGGDCVEPPQEQGGSSDLDEENAALKEDVRKLREDLAALKAHAQVLARIIM